MLPTNEKDCVVRNQKFKRAVLISNPQAGRNQGIRLQQIQNAIRELERGGTSVSAYETSKPGDGATLARSAIQAGAELVVVCGGDGSINEVVGGLAHSNVPLAVLPGGTANVLARELGLPLDVSAAARTISMSTPQRMALGRAGTRYFLLMAGIGFDARVVRGVDGRWKKRLGMASYFIEAVRQLLFEPLSPPFVLSAEGQRSLVTFACISKSQHYGPVRMVREADLFSDRFQVYCFHSTNPLRYFLYALAVLARRPARLPDFSQFRARKIYCEQIPSNGKTVYLQVDGELAGQLPCTIEIVPDALTLLVPPQSRNGRGHLPRSH